MGRGTAGYTVVKNRGAAIVMILGMASILSGCESLPLLDTTPVTPPLETGQAKETVAEEPEQKTSSIPFSHDTASDERGREEIVEIGTGRFVADSAETARLKVVDEDGITLNFQNTDLHEFVKAVLGSVLNENYTIDPAVSGQVTIQTSRPFPRSELFPLFEDVLGMNNAAIVRNGGMYQILPKDQAMRGNISPSTINRNGQNGYSVRIIPLKHIAAPEMQKILEPFLADGGDLRIDEKRNLVIVSGTRQEIDSIQETIDIFDVDWLRGMSVGLYPLHYVGPVTLKEELDSIINGIAGETGDEMLGGLVRTVSLERLNSILLIGSTVEALREVEIWMRRLDKPGDYAGKQLYVYNLQNAKAIELAEILNNIFKGETGSRQRQRPVELAPGTRPVDITNAEESENTPSSNAPTIVTDREASSSGITISRENTIEIIADDNRNALVILASQQEYQMVAAAIAKLDIVPLQVLIEASILEVTLDNNLNYGVEWFFNNKIGNSHAGIGSLDLGDSGVSALTPSFSYTVINDANNVRLALNALAAESTVKVLSSPSLMVLDNKTATINIGDEIPVPTRQSTSTIDPNSPAINEIQFRKTGVTLTVTPRVNQGGMVTMAIKQEVSNAVGTTSSNIDAPTIQQRQIESEVAINSGDTIILGGLIQDTNSDGNSGIPGFRNIPILGNLFSQNRNEAHRTELLVLITPRVVRNRNEARGITEEFRQKLQGLPKI